MHQAEIRWYVESLMSTDFPGPEERQKLRDQWRRLMEEEAAGLRTQFPFLDPNVVEAAKADYLAKCYRDIETPLLPILQHPLSQEQIDQLKERWRSLRYARVDLWRQVGGGRKDSAGERDAPSAREHSDYLLTQRSLDQLRGQLWSLLGGFPDYYREAVDKEIAAQKRRLQAQTDARAQENRLGVAFWQTEYLSFLLAALLETAETPENAGLRSGESKGDRLQGETLEGH